MLTRLYIPTLALAVLANTGIRHFVSQDHTFSADYPASWEQMRAFGNGATNKKKLDIISFPNSERLEGVVIKRGGAEIFLESGRIADKLGAEDKLIDRHTITLASAPFCSTVSIERVNSAVVTEDETPNHIAVYQDDTIYECANGSKYFTLVLRHWKDDPKHDSYEKSALQILKTLRSPSN